MSQIFPITRRTKQLSKIILALIIAVICQHFLSFTQTGLLLIATVTVMLTYMGASVFQGILHLIILLIAVIFLSLIYGTEHLYILSYDVLMGGLIGIVVNATIFPDKVAPAFRKAIIPILTAEDLYFCSIIRMFTDNKVEEATQAKQQLEKTLCDLPIWIYEKGLPIVFQKGHRHFLLKVIEIGDILFGLHAIARDIHKPLAPTELRSLLSTCISKFHYLIQAILTILALKELTETIIDFDAEIIAIDELLQKNRPTLEAFELNCEYLYLYQLTYFLKELHDTTLSLAKSLR